MDAYYLSFFFWTSLRKLNKIIERRGRAIGLHCAAIAENDGNRLMGRDGVKFLWYSRSKYCLGAREMSYCRGFPFAGGRVGLKGHYIGPFWRAIS